MNREAKLTAARAAVACAIKHGERQKTNTRNKANVIVCLYVKELRRDVENLDPKHPAEHGIAPML